MTGWARLAGKSLLLLFGLAAAGLLLRGLGFDPRAALAASARGGPAVVVLVGTLACAVGLPRQAVALACGYAFGFWSGLAAALLAQGAACAIDFWWTRLLGRRAAARFLLRREGGRLQRLDRFLAARAFTATLTLRLLPVGNNFVLNLLAGVSGVAFLPFLAGSVLGYVPQTVVFVLAGSGAGVSDGAQIALAACMLLASAGLGVLLLRRRPVPA